MSEQQQILEPSSKDTQPGAYIQNWRSTFARSMLGIMLAFGLFALIPALFSDESAVSRISKIVYLSIYLVGIIIAVFPFSDVIRVSTFLIAIFALGVSELVSYGILGDASLFFFAVVVIATIMFSPRVGWFATGSILLAITITGWAFLSGKVDVPASQIGFAKLTDWVSTSGSFLMFSAVIILGVQRLQTEISEGQTQVATAYAALQQERDHLDDNIKARTADLELARQSSEQRARQLEIIASVARSVTAMQELEQLLPVICQVVSEQFGFYHTGIFLLDERGEFAVLQAANSEGGQRMLRRDHRLRVGATGIVGTAAGQGKARIALDVGADAVYFNNPDLPDTRSEMALPLTIGEQVVGILDAQSREVGAFHEEDIAVLGILANQVSIAIENARLFSQTKQALADSQSIYQQYIKRDWAHFAQTLKHGGYSYDGIKATPLNSSPPAPPAHALTVPIKIRGLTVGNVAVRSNDPLRTWSQDEKNLAQAAAERAGLAIENFRLLTEAQRRAAKERTVGEITSRIGTSVDVREIMQTAVEELGRAMPGSEVIVQLKSRDQ
jgi:GAF domain-containing protein